MSDQLKQCTNYGCDKKFVDDDDDDLCVYHPGEPFFHDAYKGWKCCQQKSTDFTTFLSFKGCKKGKHCSDKRQPKQQQQQHVEPTIVEQIIPEEDKLPEIDLNVWTDLVLNEGKGVSLQTTQNKSEIVFCKKCRKNDVKEECVYHSGQVIFHETLKYWTCCPNKKFTDFDDFEAFIGCQKASQHEMTVAETKVREDWFQTATHVNVILYGLKGSRAQHSCVQTNGNQLKAVFKDSNGFQLFARDWHLEGLVSGLGSRVVISSSKVEIILEKVIKNKFWIKLNSN